MGVVYRVFDMLAIIKSAMWFAVLGGCMLAPSSAAIKTVMFSSVSTAILMTTGTLIFSDIRSWALLVRRISLGDT